MENKNIPIESQDVVIAGAGVAGLTAAIAASESGSVVTVIDKAPDIKRTNTSLSGGMIAFAKESELDTAARRLTVDEIVERARKIDRGHCVPELVKTWRENIDDTLAWLKKVGLQLGSTDYMPENVTVGALGRGAGLNKQLLSIAREKKCSVRFNTNGKKLLTDTKGKVTGIRAMTEHGLTDFQANAVVLATSGFQANQEMMMRYMGPEFVYNVRRTGSRYSTGDGHLMAEAVGAKLINMDQVHCRQIDKSWVPGSAGKPGPRQLQPFQHYGIVINKSGKRFIDEYGQFTRSNSVSCSIMGQPQAEAAWIFDEKIKKIMKERFENYLPPGIIEEAEKVSDIARIIGAPYEELKRTIEEYNEAVKQERAGDLDVPRTAFAFALEPPFYVIYPTWAGLNCTLGGPLINNRAQVINKENIPIPGLYAAGEMIGGFFFGEFVTTSGGATYYQGTYQVITSALSMCVVFGRIAGANAASKST